MSSPKGHAPRRIVTGQREDGESYFARIEDVEPDFRSDGAGPGDVQVFRMWANDALPVRLPFADAVPTLDSRPAPHEVPEALCRSSPQPGDTAGMRISLVRFPPRDQAARPKSPMHWHDTFDLQWLLEGELTISLDDGSEVTMRPGDVVVQHGTNHAWEAGPEGATIALVMLGAERVGVSPPAANKVDRTPQALAAAARSAGA